MYYSTVHNARQTTRQRRPIVCSGAHRSQSTLTSPPPGRRQPGQGRGPRCGGAERTSLDRMAPVWPTCHKQPKATVRLQSPSPSLRPNVHSISPSPRMVPVMWWPTRWSRTGCQGTRLKQGGWRPSAIPRTRWGDARRREGACLLLFRERGGRPYLHRARATHCGFSFITRALTTTRRERNRSAESRCQPPLSLGKDATTFAPRPRALMRGRGNRRSHRRPCRDERFADWYKNFIRIPD